jgi:hypothetical protein
MLMINPDVVACERCVDATDYFRLTRLADDVERHVSLLQCPDCEALYEVAPEVKQPALRVSLEEAHTRFPGAI